VSLLGGDLRGRLSLAQGSVVAELQQQLAQRDEAIGASQTRLAALQSDLERLSCGLSAKLAAEHRERERLAAEAAQARLLCAARGRQAAQLQQQVDALTAQAEHLQGQRQATSEELRATVASLQQALEAARDEAAGAQQLLYEAEESRGLLQRQVDGLMQELSDARLQVEWMEGKVSDLEAGGHGATPQSKQGASNELRQLQEDAQRAALQAQLERTQAQAAQLQQQHAQLQADHQALQAALEEAQHQAEEARQQAQERAAPRASSFVHNQRSEADGDDSGISSVPWSDDNCAVRECHALRAELGVAQAEVASLQRRLAAAAASSNAQLEAAQCEIMRLQFRSDDDRDAAALAANDGDCDGEGDQQLDYEQQLVGGGAAGSYSGMQQQEQQQQHPALSHDDSGDQIWHTPLPTPNKQQHHQQQAASFTADASSLPAMAAQHPARTESGNWVCVLDSPTFADDRLAAMGGADQFGFADAAAGGVPADCEDDPPADAAQLPNADAVRVHELEETVSCLRRQLRQQERALSVLQKRRGVPLVHDSAASRSAWADAMGMPDGEPPQQQLLLMHAAQHAQHEGLAAVVFGQHHQQQKAIVVQPANATTQTEEDARVDAQQQQQQQQQLVVAATAAADSRSTALLAAARHEIHRLQRVNERLLDSRAQGEFPCFEKAS